MEKSQKHNWWIRNLLVTDDYSPVALRLFGFLSYLIAALGLYLAWNPGGSVPLKESLISFSGVLTGAERDEYGIDLYFSENDPHFRYHSKADKMPDVWRALAIGDPVELLHEEQVEFGETLTVYQIAVKGVVIRSYAEIKQAYIDDDNIGWWLFFGFIISGTYLLAAAHYTEANAQALEDERRKAEAGFEE